MVGGHLQVVELHVIVTHLWQVGPCHYLHWKKNNNHSIESISWDLKIQALCPQLLQSSTTVGRKYIPTSQIMALPTQNRFSI